MSYDYAKQAAEIFSELDRDGLNSADVIDAITAALKEAAAQAYEDAARMKDEDIGIRTVPSNRTDWAKARVAALEEASLKMWAAAAKLRPPMTVQVGEESVPGLAPTPDAGEAK